MVVITPSFGPDYDLCEELNRSLLAQTDDPVRHQIIVPRRDLELFGRLACPRTEICCESDVLPAGFVRTPLVNFTINLRRPLPPVRGWILQQIIKLSAAARADADVVLLVDSDIAFIRPFTPESFVRGGVVRFYRKPKEIDDRLPRYTRWHRGARALLGLPEGAPPYTDYVSSLLAWDPSVVRRLLVRVEQVTGRRWTDAISAQLHFSEWTLYGVFVDEVLGAPINSYASDTSRCHALWDRIPLDERTVVEFVGAASAEDLAVMISAKSHTPLPVRRAAYAALKGGQPAGPPPTKE
jgi:hypothetical protein